MEKTDWTFKRVSRKSKQYQLAMSAFKKQYSNIAIIERIYISNENKVYAADWRDAMGVFNFIGGYAPCVAKTIEFVDDL